jgi:hypothetical protein
LEDNKFPKGLTPLESSFSSSDVGNKKDKEEESKRKIGVYFSVNIGTHDNPKILKIGAQCSEKEKHKFMELFHEFKDVFAWSYEDLVVLILMLFNMLFLSRKKQNQLGKDKDLSILPWKLPLERKLKN